MAQTTNYYESYNGLSGEALRAELHNIIKEHNPSHIQQLKQY